MTFLAIQTLLQNSSPANAQILHSSKKHIWKFTNSVPCANFTVSVTSTFGTLDGVWVTDDCDCDLPTSFWKDMSYGANSYAIYMQCLPIGSYFVNVRSQYIVPVRIPSYA